MIVAAYVTSFFITFFILFSKDGSADFLAYLTIWTYFVLTLYFLFSSVVVVFNACWGKGNGKSKQRTALVTKTENFSDAKGYNNIAFVEAVGTNPQESKCQVTTENSSLESLAEDITFLMKFCWLLGNIVQVFAIIVTVVYFTALFPQIGYTNCIDINLHGVNSFLVIVDTCITARPVRLLHVIHPLIYGTCYLIFSAIYWSFDHVNHVLYPGVLDWNYPGTTAIWAAALTLVVMPLLQLLHFGAYRLKLRMSCRDG